MPPTPKIVTRTLSALPPRHYGTSAKTHYASLSPEEKKANIDREDVEFKQVQAFPHERNPPFCNEFTERDWKIFEKSSKEYYEIQGGKQCIMARVLPGAIACIEHILGAQLGHQVNFLFDYTEEEQIAFMYSHFRTNLSFDKLSDDVEKVRMTCKEFSMVAFDSYGGKFNTLTNVTYKEVWLKTPLKTQAKLYLKGISPIHLSITMAAKLEQEDYTNIYAAYSIITAAAKLEVERIIGNDRVKSTTSDKVPFNPTKAPAIPFIPSKTSDEDDTSTNAIQINALKNGEPPCTNCKSRGMDEIRINHTSNNCRFACSNKECLGDSPHLFAHNGDILCKKSSTTAISKKKAMLLTVDDASDDGEDSDVAGGHFANMIRFYPANDEELAEIRANNIQTQQTAASSVEDIEAVDEYYRTQYGLPPGARIIHDDGTAEHTFYGIGLALGTEHGQLL